ncbi:MAG: hypothetical protein HKN89_02560 [Eudoraea sp.]|nr:hypothetical protein [Eudoraea sp.]
MKKYILPVLCIYFLFLSCTNDDTPLQVDIAPTIAHDITVISGSDTAVYEYNILQENDVVSMTNLTTTFGLSPSFTYLTTTTNKLTFYTNALNSFDVFQKDIGNSNVRIFPDICDEMAGETHYIARNSDENIIQIGEGLSTTSAPDPEIFVKFYDPQLMSCQRVAAGNGFLASQRGLLIYEETLYMAYQDSESDQYVLVKIDLESQERIADIRFDNPFTIAVNENLELHFFFDDSTYAIYDATSFELISESTFNDNSFLGSDGLFDTNFWDNGILVNISYPQPSEISTGPAVMDLESGDLVRGNDSFLFEVRDKLITELGYEIFFTTYEVNLQTGAVVCGFLRAGQGVGGVVYTNFNGEILKVVEVEGIPGKIVLR